MNVQILTIFWLFKKIEKSIEEIGFENTANVLSEAPSSKLGGKIGWVYKSQLSDKISSEIDKINVGEFTSPITTPGGFIILKIINKKKEL